MILTISDDEFKNIFNDPRLSLPIRWDGEDFASTLEQLFSIYSDRIKFVKKDTFIDKPLPENINAIQQVCNMLVTTIKHYLNGFPSKAYYNFRRAMKTLIKEPLNLSSTNFKNIEDGLKLFRVVSVEDNKPYKRNRVFHTPYNLCSKVTTSRYSIAGYPSLYLGTSLELCCEEIHRNPYDNFTIASVFKFEKNNEGANAHIRIIELGIKPQDFTGTVDEDNQSRKRSVFHQDILRNSDVRNAYLRWYPLIAACSFIRVNKKDPFAPEYIIPQLLMQWVRNEIEKSNDKDTQLVGIRYFSCASVRTSDMGFNYVFPTSGQKTDNGLFCSVLARKFQLTQPVYIHEYDNVLVCERHLKRKNDYDFIGS